jgi:hypothetical protein
VSDYGLRVGYSLQNRIAELLAWPQTIDCEGPGPGTSVARLDLEWMEDFMKRVIIFGSSLALVLACATTGTASAAAPADTPASASANATVREITLPAGTILPVTLDTSVGSDISRVEQPVQGHLRRAVVRNGVEVVPAGAAVSGYVTSARRPGRVKGRGYVAMRFTQIAVPGEGTARIGTATVSRTAPATKGKDAIEILAPAAGGAVIGRLVGGKKGAREGALIGGAGGTAYVLSTRGKEVRLGRGAPLSVRLTQPVTLRVAH